MPLTFVSFWTLLSELKYSAISREESGDSEKLRDVDIKNNVLILDGGISQKHQISTSRDFQTNSDVNIHKTITSAHLYPDLLQNHASAFKKKRENLPPVLARPLTHFQDRRDPVVYRDLFMASSSRASFHGAAHLLLHPRRARARETNSANLLPR